MSIHVSEPGRPVGTRLPEVFRNRAVGNVTELEPEHAINPRRSDATDAEVINAQWSTRRRALEEYGQVTGQDADAEGSYLPASRLASTSLISLPASASLEEGLAAMNRHDIDHLAVTADQSVAGLVDRQWILNWGHDHPDQGLAESFSHIELPAFLTATPETDAHQLARLMLAHHLDAALLIDRDGTAIGIVTGTDFLRLYAEASRHEGSV